MKHASMAAMALLLSGAAAVLWANPVVPPNFRPPPEEAVRPPDNAVPFRIEVCEAGQGPRLIVPRQCADRAKAVAAAEPNHSSHAATRTVLLSALAALAFGTCLTVGLAQGRRTFCTVLGLAILFGAGGYVLQARANPVVAPPVARQPDPPPPPSLTLDDVPTEVTEDGDTIRLLVPHERLAEMHARLRR
jgi:hypothetical protein